MRSRAFVTQLTLCSVLVMTGCATYEPAQVARDIDAAAQPAWSYESQQDGLLVRVSPTRQTLQIAGSYGLLIGSGVSAVVNDKYRRQIRDVLEGYDAGAVFEQHLAKRLDKAIGPGLEQVPPLTSTAGFHSARDAEEARLEGLAKSDHDLLIDLDVAYGLFGYQGTLVAEIDGEIREVPGGRTVWRNDLVASSENVLASDRLRDPTDQLMPNYLSPRFSVAEDAIEQWTGDGGVTLRQRFEQTVAGITSALLVDLGLAEDPDGYYYLGWQAMMQGDHEKAAEYLQQAIGLKPDHYDARNALAVNLAHQDKLDEAIEKTEALIEDVPDFGPAHYNLAWWYAIEKENPEAAKPHYDRALTLGMPPTKKIDKRLEKM